MSFPFLILAFESKNFTTRTSRIENFEIQTTCYFEHFLEPRIWEIVPDCIKKVEDLGLRTLNRKETMESRKLFMQVMQKVLTTSCFL